MQKAALDHIILLLPDSQLLHPPSWLTDNFTLTPGGRHADNKTENKLIIFRDGSYIELIAFINDDPALREGHWWGEKSYGIIDWALTSEGGVQDVEGVVGRLGTAGSPLGVGYARPVRGGRKRPDGKEIQWNVTFPEGVPRGIVPVFCHDVTEREVRVPRDEDAIRHPCGAVGVKRVTVVVDEGKMGRFADVYAAIMGARPREVERMGRGEMVWDLGTLIPVAAAGKRSLNPQLALRAPVAVAERQAVEEMGAAISEITIGTEATSELDKKIEFMADGFTPIVLNLVDAAPAGNG